MIQNFRFRILGFMIMLTRSSERIRLMQCAILIYAYYIHKNFVYFHEICSNIKLRCNLILYQALKQLPPLANKNLRGGYVKRLELFIDVHIKMMFT